jgi:hypothetical protein
VVSNGHPEGEKMSRNLVMKSLVAVALFVMSGCGSSSNNKQSQQPTPSPSATPKSVERQVLFNSKEAEFTKLPAKVQLTKEPYITGKAVLYFQRVSLEQKAKDEKAHWVYDTDINQRKFPFAANLEEVGTIILSKCEEISLGNYEKQFTEEKIPAYGWKCEVTIIDKTIPAVIHRKTFQTQLDDHKFTGKDAKEIHESAPNIEINNFLDSLPQK